MWTVLAVNLAVALFVSWRAALWLEPKRFTGAIITGLVFTLVGRLGLSVGFALLSDLSDDDLSVMFAIAGPIALLSSYFGSAFAFALIGVLAWCGYEKLSSEFSLAGYLGLDQPEQTPPKSQLRGGQFGVDASRRYPIDKARRPTRT